MNRFGKNLLMTAFIISLFLHFGTGLFLYLKKSSKPSANSIEVTIIDKNKKPEDLENKIFHKNDARQIVEQSEKAVNNEIDDKAKFLSRHNQKVVTQTRAANNGQFQNDAKQGQAPKVPVPHPHQEQKKVAQNSKHQVRKHSLTSPDGDVTLPKLSDLKPQFHWDNVKSGVANPGLRSQTDDYLKDIQVGPQTLLSSREFVYYSYYTRIKERLRMFWEPKIKEKVTRLLMSGRHLASDDEKITRLVITLDRQGKLIRVQVMGPSGLKDLDDAAIEAFQQAAPFPHPPKGIIDPDGTIKIRWDFILQAGSSFNLEHLLRFHDVTAPFFPHTWA